MNVALYHVFACQSWRNAHIVPRVLPVMTYSLSLNSNEYGCMNRMSYWLIFLICICLDLEAPTVIIKLNLYKSLCHS